MTDRTTYRAKWLVPDPWTVLENGYVCVHDGVIDAMGSGPPPGGAPVVDLGPGAMTAPLVNAHTHLELSALRGAVSTEKDFRTWVADLMAKRAALPEAALIAGAVRAISRLSKDGCGAVGEVSTLGITREPLASAGLAGIFFREHLGTLNPSPFSAEAATPLSHSLAAHGPHTTAPAVFRRICQTAAVAGLPMSVHLAESEDEIIFITSGRGPWADFLTQRGIDFSSWPLPARSPVQYLDAIGALIPRVLAVHLLYCSVEDRALLRRRNASVCLCPRSNFLLHRNLPDIPGFLAAGFTPCLGTDSLASSPSLDIADEMAFIARKYESIPPREILAMATVYGAAALGIEGRLGRLCPGSAGPPRYVPIEAETENQVLPAVVTAGNAQLIDIPKEANDP